MDEDCRLGVALVSSYPPRNKNHPQMSGVASMAKNQANCLSSECQVSVYSNIIEEREIYNEQGVNVNRCWERDLSYLYDIPKAIYDNRDDTDIVHLHHEYNGLYGGIVGALFFPILILTLRVLGFKVVTRLHGIIFSTREISDQLIDSPLASLPDSTLEFGLKLYNQVILLLSNETLVFEQVFKQRLIANCLVAERSVSVIPHGIETIEDAEPKPETLSPDLNLLFFGYLSPRKGPDLLLKAADNLSEWSITLAGGPLPYLCSHDKYQLYYDSLVRTSAQLENVELTGFIDEREIEAYFTRADIVVLPYRVFIAASGVHSLAMKYGKPVLMSEQFSEIFYSPDIHPLLNQNNTHKSQISFSNEKIEEELPEMLDRIATDREMYRRIAKISDEIRETRSWDNIAAEYIELYRSVVHHSPPKAKIPPESTEERSKIKNV
jgi:glycosyltransferase involved in cell wall biosynthesis